MSLAYVDASALTKLILDEPWSGAMRQWYVEAERVTSSVIGLIETRRAVSRQMNEPERVERILGSVITLEVNEVIVRVAGSLRPATLGTLDAVHLASALGLLGQLTAFVTYDDRLAEAARAAGLPVVRPA